jgi:hypothetical protein
MQFSIKSLSFVMLLIGLQSGAERLLPGGAVLLGLGLFTIGFIHLFFVCVVGGEHSARQGENQSAVRLAVYLVVLTVCTCLAEMFNTTVMQAAC